MAAQSRIRSVVFDAVGTLIYPEPGVAQVYAASGAKHGSRLTVREVRERFQAAFNEIEQRDRAGALRTSEQVEKTRWQAIVAAVFNDVANPHECFAELFAHFARADSWRVFPDVLATLCGLAERGIELGIASNFDERLLEIARRLPPLELFRHVFLSSRLGYRKPHPEFFYAIASALGNAPHEVLYVGDDFENDVVGARSIGMRALLLDRSSPAGRTSDDAGTACDERPRMTRAGAGEVEHVRSIRSLAEIPRWITR